MISPAALLKEVGADGQLLPYYKTLILYVVVWASDSNSSARVVAKVLPVLYLAVAVRRHSKHCPKESDQLRVCVYVSRGLLLSACGDALLEWGLFEPGMGAFAAAQGCYWRAWGPQRHLIPRVLVSLCAVWYSVWLSAPAPGVLQWLVPLYGAVLSLCVGRGVVRGWGAGGWHRKAGAAGSVMFGVSDALLGYSMFRGELSQRTLKVMGTYYAAQYGIALAAFQHIHTDTADADDIATR